MRLLTQKTLYFSQGKSDKVYEVSLLDAGDDLFVVNFRYGRRGKNLKDGTKTVFPVVYEEAVIIYDKLIASKEKKGYSDNLPSGEMESISQAKTPVNSAREETILKYLEQGINHTYTRNWKMSRIIWKAAVLRMASAIPFIKHFIYSEDEFEQYAAIHALGQLGDYSDAPLVDVVFGAKGFESKVGRIAAAYILKSNNTELKKKIKEAAFQKLPDSWQQIFLKGEVLQGMSLYYLQKDNIEPAALYYAYIYSVDNEQLMSQVFEVIQSLPLQVNRFKSIRYIYRAAELLEDTSVFALVSKRIAVSDATYTGEYVVVDNRWVKAFYETKKNNPSVAFSGKTKQYFNRATYSNVIEWSKENPDKYISYATELLCFLDDELDKASTKVEHTYAVVDGQYVFENRFFPKYANFLTLMFILYGNSEKVSRAANSFYSTDKSIFTSRERHESLPELWNKHPKEVLRILANNKSEMATYFSLNIIKSNRRILEDLSKEMLIQLLGHSNSDVLDLMEKVLQQRYLVEKPDADVLVATLRSNSEKLQGLGLDWLKQYEADYFSDSSTVAALLLTGNKKVIAYIAQIYAESIKYHIPLTVRQLDSFFEMSPKFETDYLVQVSYLIGETHFGELLRTTPREKIEFLARSTNTNKLFAINLGKHNEVPVYELFKDSFDEYISSDDPILRKAGIELLSHFPDAFLLDNRRQIGAYCFSEHSEVREAILPTVKRLVALDESFKSSLLQQLLQTIGDTETYAGVHADSYELLVELYGEDISSITDKEILSLVLSKYEFAQKLGTPMLLGRVDIKALSMDELVSLSQSAVLAVREYLHTFFNENVARVNYELEDALRIFNSDWEDVIDWACDYFGEHIETRHWNVDMLLYVSDHTNYQVQSFGRQMITSHFSEEKGLPLLLKLQEHPTRSMQFFVTNYLNTYAADKPEVVLKLEHYFLTVLFSINESRAAKTRVYAFLEQESLKDESVAKMTVRIISAILGTHTKLDISHNIDLLLAIHEAHPKLEIPILIKTS